MANWYYSYKMYPLTYRVKTNSGLIWRCHIEQLHVPSPGSTNNPKNTEDLINVSPIVRDHTDRDNLVQNSVHPANSTFADRYPVRQHRPPDRYGISSPADRFFLRGRKCSDLLSN